MSSILLFSISFLCIFAFYIISLCDQNYNYSNKIISTTSDPVIITRRTSGKSPHDTHDIRLRIDTLDCYIEIHTSIRLKSKAQLIVDAYSTVDKAYYVWQSKWNSNYCYYEELPNF